MTETPKKKTATKKATSQKSTTTKKPAAQASEKGKTSPSFLAFELPKFELPKFDVPKLELPKFELPKLDVPKLDLPKVDVPAQVTEVAERGRDFVTDSVKTARKAAGSVRKNVSETVVLVREVVGV